jgi:ubiquinol-cytochrome c reductase cytochrome b subunit
MTNHDNSPQQNRWRRFLIERTRLPEFINSLFDEPADGVNAWVRTTAGIVAILLLAQVVTGTLLAFYYVPTAEAAHMSVSYIEKVIPSGSWVRAVHHYGSQWLTVFLVLHLAQMFWRASYRTRTVAWLATVILLALVLAGGVTGYSLPWDARAFFGTRVAEGIAAGLPLIGPTLQRYLLGGTDISTMTLSRFFGLHVFIVPALILLAIVARVFVFREPTSSAEGRTLSCQQWQRKQFLRQSIAAGLVFLALSIYAIKFRAPLGPAVNEAESGYLPRPGAQFLWLFQMLKYLPGGIASIIAVLVPKLIIIGLILLPFLDARMRRKHPEKIPRRRVSVALFAGGILLMGFMTAMAYISDARDPNTRAQLAQQEAEETAFRAQPFEPLRPRKSDTAATDTSKGDASTAKVLSPDNPPASYLKRCANCHGTRGQGVKPFPGLLGVSAKPRRTVEDIIGLLNDPVAYGLEPPMKSFATKLTDPEKREIGEWLMVLQKP